jgi:hypothetical protein
LGLFLGVCLSAEGQNVICDFIIDR